MPSISKVTSLGSTERSVSSCSDLSVDANCCDRRYVEDSGTDSSQEDSGSSVKGSLNRSNTPVYVNGFHQGNGTTKEDSKELSSVNNYADREVEIVEVHEASGKNGEKSSSSLDGASGSSLLNDEVDAEFWIPPDAVDQKDDVVGSIANYEDDDDECGDDVGWGKPSSLNSFGEEGSESHRFKEEKLKVMNDVKNGKFLSLVSQLLKSVDVDSHGTAEENWVDIVTNLSWEAAAFVKPDTVDGKAMDPDGYVKIKCIATGSRTQSQLVKGLVFKKNATHKHMPTKYKNPRLLLIHGSLDLSSVGLSSFKSMKQEKENLKSVVDMIDMYHPNVMLVEKSVDRGIQESILAKGITLVIDMKLHRLERVARCIGSPIMAQEVSIGQKLRQCDLFHIEKFVEDLCVSTDGGKKPRKTLMFLVGAPSRLGCTILLMGANSDVLKRVKCVVRCAVFMAYHLMLETSFLLDQTAMFSTILPNNVVDLALTSNQSVSVVSDEATMAGQKQSVAENETAFSHNAPVSNGFPEVDSHDLILTSYGNSSFSFKEYSPATFPGLSISPSIQKVMNDSFSMLSDSFVGRNESDQTQNSIQICDATEDTNHVDQTKVGCREENLVDGGQPYLSEICDKKKGGDGTEGQMQSKDEINSVLDSESILILMSSRNAARGTICEQSHFSHIKFYRSFDVPLGKFLQNNLLNQRHQCKTCDEHPEAHFFYYAHHNRQLTIQLRRLPGNHALPGESEGKLWMWSRCGRCKVQDSECPKSTKRVLISNAARGLSFGKFLEIGFSNHSSFDCLSSCGHSFHKDFLYFFGLGTMVAMFKYSPIVTYSVFLPPQKIVFSTSIKPEFLKKDCENVYLKGISMFLEIEKSLKDLKYRYDGVSLNIQGSSMEFSDIVEMLNQEKYQFEVEVKNLITSGTEGDAICKLLSLNRLRMELFLESCVWDQCLHTLLSSDFKLINPDPVEAPPQEPCQLKENSAAEQLLSIDEIPVEKCNGALENISESNIKQDVSVESNCCPVIDIPIDGDIDESQVSNSVSADDLRSTSAKNGSADCNCVGKCRSEGGNLGAVEGNDCQEDKFDLSAEFQAEKSISIATNIKGVATDSNHSMSTQKLSMTSNLENYRGWIWAPFADIRRGYMEDLKRGFLPKFESYSSYNAQSMAQKLISDEGSRLHIPLGPNNCIVSDYEDEFSSIIACALTLLSNVAVGTDDQMDGALKEKWMDTKSNESSHGLPRMFSLSAPRWTSNGSFDPGSISTPPSRSLDLLNSLVSFGASNPEISISLGKHPGSRKYSVVCVYASEFCQLRDLCCPSEASYIAALSRCRNWDAKGGKSKSFFAKTLDDRFIIKEIKKTEFDSFLKFAPNYFKYMKECYEIGNQTCLAKILGIYQVVIRATANGKEARHDLLVMENLSFGRQMARQYDLKGALHSRFNSAGNGSGDVLLDQNFVNDMNVSPVYVSRKSKWNLQRAVYNDTSFLNSVNVMDYSLLVGVDTQRRELVCGIIDYLRQYTWDKQLENWVKASLVIPKNQLPTIISPKEYKKRFRKFIYPHFLSVPDNWCSRRSFNPCKLCGPHTSRATSRAQGKQNGFFS